MTVGDCGVLEVGTAVDVLTAVGIVVAVNAGEVTEIAVAEGAWGVADAPTTGVGEAAGSDVEVEAGAPVAGPM